jgi:hypothetical protein
MIVGFTTPVGRIMFTVDIHSGGEESRLGQALSPDQA